MSKSTGPSASRVAMAIAFKRARRKFPKDYGLAFNTGEAYQTSEVYTYTYTHTHTYTHAAYTYKGIIMIHLHIYLWLRNKFYESFFTYFFFFFFFFFWHCHVVLPMHTFFH
jgi:hypothetical protein